MMIKNISILLHYLYLYLFSFLFYLTLPVRVISSFPSFGSNSLTVSRAGIPRERVGAARPVSPLATISPTKQFQSVRIFASSGLTQLTHHSKT